jgi:peptide/nickel transport system ATP-binding protein
VTEPLLDVAGLRVTYPGPPAVRAVDDLTLSVGAGEVLGVLGESGSGKSTFARAVIGLLPEATVEGAMRFAGRDLGALDDRGWRELRWRHIALSFQSGSALNPVLRVGDQIVEPLRVHLGLGRREAEARTDEVLTDVALGAWAASRHPRELSGGQRRLALLAMALSCRPELMILDEPTAGLDPVTRELVSDLLRRLREESGVSLVVLSHDADVLADVAQRVAVLYRGWLAEIGPEQEVLDRPRHPYTWGLLNARPTMASVKDLRGIRGDPPDPADVATGCPFFGRCTQGLDGDCTTARPPLIPADGEDGGRVVSCVRAGVVAVLSARNLSKCYSSPGGFGHRRQVQAVDDVSVEVHEGEVVGLVGSTGAGKSTLGMLLVRLLEADGGEVRFEGRDLLRASRAELKDARRRIQLLFQDPYEALSPRLTVAQAVREPLDVQEVGEPDERDALVRSTLLACRLRADDAFLARHTHELSGGQLQRVALARALVLEPKMLVADEAVAMLDPSEQAKVLQLLKHLQVERGMSMVFISHDLAVVLRVADRVLILDAGRVVDHGDAAGLLASAHPVTRRFLAASGADRLLAAGASANGGPRSNPPTDIHRPQGAQA